MELPGEAYFYALAALSMTFVGFAAVVITLRQNLGLPLTPLQLLTTRQYIELGLMASGFAILAPLLALCGIEQPLVWRATSAIILAVRLPTLSFIRNGENQLLPTSLCRCAIGSTPPSSRQSPSP